MKNSFFLILFLSSFASAEELIFQCEDGYSQPACLYEGIPSSLSDYAREPNSEEYQEPKPLISNTNVAWEEWLESDFREGEYQWNDQKRADTISHGEQIFNALCW